MSAVTNFELIVTIVPKGKASRLIKAAKEVGAEGSTIFNGRGAGIHESKKMFGLSIEPEKEIMLTVVPDNIRKEVVEAIRKEGELDQSGAGIGFVVNVQELFGVNHVIGQREKKKE
ncbi:P-II family nitrogen regulator [Bacillus sp. FJAT-44742]|uniref:P-II family nitrogen regulator n=1 Tax=Bacillus sp. FJAT-44742 TaxID=2014005 RepID=UPI000C231A6C|nr:P-II family nitrogen regulator [Bacillus sp. FJAT-44742]